MTGWRDALENFDADHRLMLEGGSLSQLFLRYPLTVCHPLFVGVVYGILASLTLIMPFAYAGWSESTPWEETLNGWAVISLIFTTMTASLGGFSLLISGFAKRPPIRLENRRRYLFPFSSTLSDMVAPALPSLCRGLSIGAASRSMTGADSIPHQRSKGRV